ncbi:hypothetical protein HPB48_012076 [Haemaphysalis longicornis]|uniref:CCHC-type domain-containing protein n=1 Tax=Haemaphysalis longicornis TaxID=44386 RepID=A0A9J6H3R0_HAELO|nr:hypothetical protein HPB48_012076 [Haemaphysalis longicornis]
MFVLRLVTLDHYMVAPSAPLDPLVSKLGGWEVWQVPVIRIFGITPAGQKACLHVHGAMPYLTVPCTEPRPERFAVVLASEIDLLLNTAAGRATSMHRHVHHVSVIRATPLYGFHDREQTFLRIFLYNPLHVAKVSELLLSGLVLKRVMQPHEAHVPFTLQFMVDHNLHGMGLVRVDPFKFRRPTCWKPSGGARGKGPTQRHGRPPLGPPQPAPAFRMGLPHISMHRCQGNVVELFGDLEKQAVCELELDCCARDILNAQETEDEDFPSSESEQFYLARLDKLLPSRTGWNRRVGGNVARGAKPKKSHHHNILDTSHSSPSWSSRDPSASDNGGLWENAVSRTQHRAARKADGEPASPTSQRQRTELGTYVLRVQPTVRCDMTIVDPEDLNRAISSFSADAALLRHQILRVSKLSNSITLTTCDPIQAGRIREMTELPLQTIEPIPVRVHQVPNEGMSRGVIYRCRPNEPKQKLVEALYADGVEILAARPMGSRGTVLLCFALPQPPRNVLYRGFPRRVERYEQRSLVCSRCHNPGHKACVCPAKNPVCSTCGRSEHSPSDCPNGERKYCVLCRQDGHMAIEPTCPAHVAFEEKANKKHPTSTRQRNNHRRRRGPSHRLFTGALATDAGGDDTRLAHNYHASHAPSPTSTAAPGVTYASTVTRSATTPEAELTNIQREMEQEHKAYKQDMQRLQQQINCLQKQVEDTKKQYARKQKAREERVKMLSANIAGMKQIGHELPERSAGQRPSPGRKDKQPELHDLRPSDSTQQHSKRPDQTPTTQHPPDPKSPPTWQSTTIEEPTWLKSFQDQLLQQHHSQERLLQQHIQLQQTTNAATHADGHAA